MLGQSAPMKRVQVLAVKFKSTGAIGDFSYMKDLEEFRNTLFIFNDNVAHHTTAITGGGNAVMRQYNKYALMRPLSAGIPTGINGGFVELNEEVKQIVDDSITEIKELIEKHSYDTIVYSAHKQKTINFKGKEEPLLGTSIFHVDEEVLKYITAKIYSLQ